MNYKQKYGIMKSHIDKGLSNLNHKQNLYNYAQELVANFAPFDGDNYILSVLDLPEEEQNELTRLFIEYSDRDLCECVYGGDFSIDNDYTCALLSLLKDNSSENQEHFAEITRKNTIKYYRQSLDEILDIACNDFIHNLNNEKGYQAQYDMNHGDIIWR